MINPFPVLPEFEYIRPKTAEEAIQFLQSHPEQARPFLGGTDCLVALRNRRISPNFLVDLKYLDGFQDVIFHPHDGLTIAAAVSMNEMIASEPVKMTYPLIAAAAREVGGYQLRSRATLIGNICNASPCGDTIAPCLVYRGMLAALGPDGKRCIALKDFFLGPGKTILQPDEIVCSIRFPLPPAGSRGKYLSIVRNALGDLAIAAVTILAFPDASQPSGYCFRIALTAVAPTVIFAEEAQRLLSQTPLNEKTLEQAALLAGQCCSPIDDIRASAHYRREMVRVLTGRALQQVWNALQKDVQQEGGNG